MIVSRTPQTPRLLRLDAVRNQISNDPTRIILDLGYANVPVDELEVRARTRRYDRAARVEGSNDGKLWVPLATARVFRLSGSEPTSIRIDGRHRYLRLSIVNGDDPPLERIAVAAFARPRPLLIEGGHARSLRMLYGNSLAGPPSYDFARLPPPKRMERGTLGREQRNAAFEPPPDTRSFAARHSRVVTAALVVAALAVAFAGVLALRRRA